VVRVRVCGNRLRDSSSSEDNLHGFILIAPKGFSINQRVEGERLERVKALLEFVLSPEKQIETALRVKTFPTRTELYSDERLLADEVLNKSMQQINNGIPLPIITEMRAIWDAMRPPYQAVLGGSITPNEAAKQMQKQSLASPFRRQQT